VVKIKSYSNIILKMSAHKSYRDKVKALQLELEKAEKSLNAESCFSTTYIIAAIIPIVIGFALYMLSPKWVMSAEKNMKPTISYGKIGIWTAVITIILWGCLYGYTTYMGSESK